MIVKCFLLLKVVLVLGNFVWVLSLIFIGIFVVGVWNWLIFLIKLIFMNIKYYFIRNNKIFESNFFLNL